MTGQDLLDKLSRLSKEELSYPIVEDDEWGFWNFTGFYIDNDADFYKPAKGDSSMGTIQ